ncbi:MAG: competence protein, partial [Acetomicrobium flavidum]|nr:competence protein [Acetomicrobium flavidum]
MLKGNNVVLIAVGDELIAGLKKEANISWLSAELTLRGQDVVAMEVIPDQEEVLVDLLDRWAGRIALIVISGGLGPTHDDRTREAVAKFLGLPLVAEKDVYDRIISRYPAD